MGKVKKRQPLRNSNHHDNAHRNEHKKAVSRRQHSQNAPRTVKVKSQSNGSQSSSQQNKQQNQKPSVPFSRHDRVLLVGEGDFSFTVSLRQNHKVGHILATCFDSWEQLETKYEGVEARIEPYTNSLSTQAPEVVGTGQEDEVWRGFSPTSANEGQDCDGPGDRNEADLQNTALLFGIDATRLSTTHKKVLRAHAPFTKIVFNFPHVGGLSTDVNRQVRANQELLVNFFNAAKPLLATASKPARAFARNGEDDDYYTSDYDSDGDRQEETDHLQHGQILVTLFEGEPYTLWNIRDLARHSGLKVVESFKFPWAAYAGYQHARTVGDITTGRDRSDDGKRKGKWRGEEREARCYVLALKDDNDGKSARRPRKKGREGREEGESDS